MRRLSSLIAILALSLLALPVHAQKKPDNPEIEKPTPFDQGKIWLSLGGGYSNERFSISGSFGYFIFKGVETSVNGSVRFGNDTLPTTGTLGPGVRYIVWQIPKFHPYGGAFYRHWFVGDGFDDLDSVGARAGAIFNSKPVLIEGGIVYESFLNCDGDDCSDVYPEFSFGITF